MEHFSAKKFSSDRAWGSVTLADFGEMKVKMHWTNKPYVWHHNSAREVFVVLDGVVDMHVRENGVEKIVRLHQGDGMTIDAGDEHVAHPVGEARILVVEENDAP